MKGWYFGALLRAARYRYHPLPAPAKGLLRISDHPKGTLCELRPLELVPNERNDGREFYSWWENGGDVGVVQASPYLRALKVVKRPYSVVLDADGVEVPS